MRKLKSIAVCALCLCLLLGLAGCAAAQRPLRVTLVLKTETDVAEFWGMLLSGVRKAASNRFFPRTSTPIFPSLSVLTISCG